MLTASEVDAALLQYSFQSQAEEPMPPTPRAWPVKKRRDWSRAAEETEENFVEVPTRRGDSYISSSTTSNDPDIPFPSTSTTPLPQSNTVNSFASTSTSQAPIGSFPYSSESYYSLPTPTPVEPIKVEPYKRGAGNSMFGGRVRQMKVSKSPSSFSLKSSASASSKKSSRITRTNDIEGGGAGGDETGEGETEDEKSHRTRDSSLPTEDESEDQIPSGGRLKRVSLGLDDIETELSKTYLRMTADHDLDGEGAEEEERLSRIAYQGERSTSPAGSDTEPIDPFFHRLRPTPITPKFSRNSPTFSSTVPSPTSPSSSLDNPILQPPSKPFAHSNSPSLNTLSPDRDPSIHNGSERDVSTPVPSSSSFAPSLSNSPTRSPYSASQLLARSYNSPGFIHPFDENRIRVDSQSYSNQSHESSLLDEFPESYNFPTPSSRNNSTSTRNNSTSTRGGAIGENNSDEGPFDLSSARGSLASKGSLSSRSKKTYGMDNRRRAYAATSASTGPPSTIFGGGPFRNDSMSSVGSVGSSYHPASNNSNEDDESGLPKERTTLEEGATLESLRIPDHSPVSRVPSKEELLQDIRSNGIGSDNGGIGRDEEVVPIEVEDLVLIQETLVRSASRRAALRAATPSLHSSSSPSIAQTESRKHSMETSEGIFSATSRKSSVDGELSSSKRPSSFDRPVLEEAISLNRSVSDHSIHSITPSSFPTPSSIDSLEFTSAVTSRESCFIPTALTFMY